MKILHYDSSGNYTGYSVNSCSIWDKVFTIGGNLLMSAGSAVIGYLATEYLATRPRPQKKQQSPSPDGFEDPK